MDGSVATAETSFCLAAAVQEKVDVGSADDHQIPLSASAKAAWFALLCWTMASSTKGTAISRSPRSVRFSRLKTKFNSLYGFISEPSASTLNLQPRLLFLRHPPRYSVRVNI